MRIRDKNNFTIYSDIDRRLFDLDLLRLNKSCPHKHSSDHSSKQGQKETSSTNRSQKPNKKKERYHVTSPVNKLKDEDQGHRFLRLNFTTYIDFIDLINILFSHH